MIQMIAGVFGLPIKKDGKTIRIKGMGPNDGPFSVSPEREAELVEKGVARYVEEQKASDDASVSDPIGFDDMPPEDIDDCAEDEAEIVEEFVDLKSLSAKELRAMGKEYGITFKANDKKKTIIDAITAAQIALASSEDAPTFDPAGAVE